MGDRWGSARWAVRSWLMLPVLALTLLPGREARAEDREGEGIVAAVAVVVRPDGPAARVTVSYRLTLTTDGPALTPIGLAGLVPGRVAEADLDLPVRPVGPGWGVLVRGRGEHAVAVTTVVPVRTTLEGQRLDLELPPAPTTEVLLQTPEPLSAAEAGPDEPLVVDPTDRQRAQGHLRPRTHLALAWRSTSPTGADSEASLIARGEILVRPGPTTWTTDETWAITVLRGVAHDLRLPVDGDGGELGVQVDGLTVPSERRPRATGPGEVLHLTLPQAWAPAAADGAATPVHLVRVVGRHRYPPRAGDGSILLEVAGHPPEGRVAGQVVGVAPSEAWQVFPGERPGWVRVDPRSLKGLGLVGGSAGPSGAWLALSTEGQAARLGLTLRPIQPRFQTRLQTAVTLGPERASVAATWLGAVERGRLDEVRVEVPPGLRWDHPVHGPPGLMVRLDDPPAAAEAGSVLVATFDPPLDAGQTFSLGLRGSCPIPAQGVAPLRLFRPLAPEADSSDLALVLGADRRLEVREPASEAQWRRLPAGRGPEGWTWPQGATPDPEAAVAWFRSDQVPAALSVALEPCPPVIRHHSRINVAVDRLGADLIEEVVGEVAAASLGALEIALPPDLIDRWAIEATEGVQREPLGEDPATGWHRYRLRLPRAGNTFQFRVRSRLDWAPDALGPPDSVGVARRLVVRPLAVLTGRSTGRVVRINANPDIGLTTRAPGWTPRVEPPQTSGDSGPPVREVWETLAPAAVEPLTVVAQPTPLAPLPTVVASRLWLQSVQRGDGQVALAARYRLETHDQTVTLRLPPGSRWVRGTIGGVELGPGAVEQRDATTVRVLVPPNLPGGPVEFQVATLIEVPPPADTWPAPELVGGVVQQTVWELVPAGARVGVGVPDGWSDENHWVRHGVFWRREPSRTPAALARWVANEPLVDRDWLAPAPNPADFAPQRPPLAPVGPTPATLTVGADDDPAGPVRYLFGHPGPPETVRFVTLARSTLLLVCSGPVLLVGLLILARRPPVRGLPVTLLVGAFVLVVVLDGDLLLLVVESSALGLALLGIAVVLQQVIERRGSGGGATPAVRLDPLLIEVGSAATEVSAGALTAVRLSPTNPTSDSLGERTTSPPASRSVGIDASRDPDRTVAVPPRAEDLR